MSDVGTVLAVSLPLSLSIAAAGSAVGIGSVFRASVEAVARQPEAAGKIMVTSMIGAALIEALTIYVLIVVFLLYGRIG
jgi:F-type H+-transporting ATPase subunit c